MYVVLFVSTGNICRSPAAEALLRRDLDSTVTVASAGTWGLRDQPVHPPMARVLTADGIDTSGFRSHRLTTSDVRDADLVLTVTAAHRGPRYLRKSRRRCAALCPSASWHASRPWCPPEP